MSESQLPDRAPDPSTPEGARLLGFYDRLRRRITGALAERGRWGEPTAEALLLVPDVFFLLARLALDRRVPKETRALLGGTLAYFLLPLDLVPEAFLGVGGFLDDLVIAAAALSQALDEDLERIAAGYWSGKTSVRDALSRIASSADDLLAGRGLERVKRYLGERGLGR